MKSYLRLLGGLGLVVMSAVSAARAAPADDYVTLMTGVEIDRVCGGGLKYMESAEARSAAQSYLQSTAEFSHNEDGRLSDEDYNTWLAGLDQRVRDNAAAVGCSEQALQYILPARAAASESLYRGLVLAFYFDAQTDFLTADPLDDHRKKAAAGYDAYLQQLYGQHFATFSSAQRERAMQELPQKEVNIFDPDGAYDMFGGLDVFGGDNDLFAYMPAKSIAHSAMNAVQFEVTAEASGFLVRPLVIAENWVIPELRNALGGLPIVDGPAYRLLDPTPDDADGSRGQLYSVVALMPDGVLRAMFYGTTAEALAEPTVRLYVRSQPRPEGASGWDVFKRPTFREEATAFDGVRVEGACLGKCFDFPPGAHAAMLANPEDDYAEFFVAATADAAPPEITASTTDRQYLLNVVVRELAGL